MASTAKLEWWVDEREYKKFRQFVGEKHGVIDLCFPSEVVQAMRAFIDKDRAAEVEDELSTLSDVLADVFDDFSRRRTSFEPTESDLDGKDTIKVRCEVPAILKEEFSTYIKENSEWGLGEALSRAMNEYRLGGREQRLADGIRNIVEELRSSTSSAGSSEKDSDSKPYGVEEKVTAIKNELAERNKKDDPSEITEFPRPQLVDCIHKYCAKGDREKASEKTVDKYVDRITSDLNFCKHRSNDVLFVAADQVEGPAFKHYGYDSLSTDERVEAIQVTLLRRAKKNDGGAQLSADAIQNEVFNGEPSDSVAHDLRKRACGAIGFDSRTGESEKTCVKVDLREVVDPDLLEAAGLPTPDREDQIRKEAQAEGEALSQAEMVTDGGVDNGGDI